MTRPLLELDGLEVRHGRVAAVRALSLAVHEGGHELRQNEIDALVDFLREPPAASAKETVRWS